MNNKKYENLDGMRAYACLAIVLMHVMGNGYMDLSGFVFEKVIHSFTYFTLFFMEISAFSMCCGYFERIRDGSIRIDQFYKRRYEKVWPFFAILCTIELILEHSLNSLYEWFADLTLVFGLIPNNSISVVGVGWFLGTIFVFYMIFPFFTVIIKNTRNAWLVLIASIILHLLCDIRFADAANKGNIIYSSMFFVSGGVIYLYREKLQKFKASIVALIVVALAVGFLLVNDSYYMMLLLFTALLVLGIVGNGKVSVILFRNKTVCFIGSISMEIYLCHMFVYRLIEKMKLTVLFQNRILNYILVSVGTIFGAIILSIVLKKLIVFIERKTPRAV